MSSDIHILFADLASKGEIDSLTSLILLNQENLSQITAYALLLCFLPESLHIKNAAKLMKAIYDLPNSWVKVTDSAFIEDISFYVSSKIKSIGWNYPIFPLDSVDNANILFLTFIKCYIRNNDSAKRDLESNFDFAHMDDDTFQEFLHWKTSSVDVLRNFRKYYSFHNQPWLSLYEFECAHPKKVVPFLLQYSDNDTIFRDVNDLVMPYIYFYEGKDALWKWISSDNESISHLELLESLIRHGGIKSHSLQNQFLRCIITTLYLHKGTSEKSYHLLNLIHTLLKGYIQGDDITNKNFVLNERLSCFDEIFNSSLTQFSDYSLAYLEKIIKSASLLKVALIDVLIISGVGSEEEQRKIINKCLFSKYNKNNNLERKNLDENKWNAIYESVKWLQMNTLSKISDTWIDQILLTSALSSGCFAFVKNRFISSSCSLSLSDIKTLTIETFYSFFDSATNGNRTRGSMKNSVQCLHLLQNFEDNDNEIFRAEALLSATDELSNYTLYLPPEKSNTQNMPMSPKQIRHYPNKLELIYRVLELNSKAYLDYDKLVSLLKNLIYSASEKTESKTNPDFNSLNVNLDLLNESASFQIRKMCIEAALVDSNFDKAYELAIPYLVSTSTVANKKDNFSTVDDFGLRIVAKETESWASLFQIGKYISPFWEPDIPIEVLDKKMNALAYSLKICPQDQIPVILHTWQRCDTLRNDALKKSYTQKSGGTFNETVTAAISSAPSLLPTNFKKVISSTASSLSVSSPSRSFGFLDNDNGNSPSLSSRRRDQISNLFVSGLGWAIGANQQK